LGKWGSTGLLQALQKNPNISTPKFMIPSGANNAVFDKYRIEDWGIRVIVGHAAREGRHTAFGRHCRCQLASSWQQGWTGDGKSPQSGPALVPQPDDIPWGTHE
jgi:hypothetical protein